LQCGIRTLLFVTLWDASPSAGKTIKAKFGGDKHRDKKISSLDLMPFIECFGRTQDKSLKTAAAIQAVPTNVA
jgi:hypothetical protein